MLKQTKDAFRSIGEIKELPPLFVIHFIVGLAIAFRHPFMSLFGLDEAKLSNITFGILMCVITLFEIILATYIAKLSDSRWKRKPVLILCSLAAVIAYVSFAFLRDFYALLIIGAVFFGISSSVVPQLWAYVRELLNEAKTSAEKTPLIMNTFRMFFTLSWVLGPAVAAWILLQTSFKGLFLFGAAMYLLSAIVILFIKKEPEKLKAAAKAPVKLGKFIFTPNIFANLVAFLLINAAGFISMLNLPQLVTKILNGNEANVGIIFSIPPIIEVPLMIVFGVLATKWGNGILIKMSFLVASVYFFLLVTATEVWQIYPIQILNAMYIAVIAGNAMTYFQDFLPDQPGTATTLYLNTSKAGYLVGFLTFGFVSEFFGFELVQYVCAAITFISFIILVLFGRTNQTARVSSQSV